MYAPYSVFINGILQATLYWNPQDENEYTPPPLRSFKLRIGTSSKLREPSDNDGCEYCVILID